MARQIEYRYQLAPGFHISKKNFELLAEEVKELRPDGERPTPDELIKSAKRKKSRIHHLFEWDVSRAAYQRWYNQAQEYLRSFNVVAVEVETGHVVSPPVRAWQPVKHNGHIIPPESYVPVERLKSPIDVEIIFERAEADFRSLIRRYRNYAEFFNVFRPVIRAFEMVVKKLEYKRLQRSDKVKSKTRRAMKIGNEAKL